MFPPLQYIQYLALFPQSHGPHKAIARAILETRPSVQGACYAFVKSQVKISFRDPHEQMS
jgi:hypothetical protein